MKKNHEDNFNQFFDILNILHFQKEILQKSFQFMKDTFSKDLFTTA